MATALIRVDCGASFLPLCSCGWRGDPHPTRSGASLEGAAHARRAHTGDPRAAKSASNRIHYRAGRR